VECLPKETFSKEGGLLIESPPEDYLTQGLEVRGVSSARARDTPKFHLGEADDRY
jgi:hypothetical protein